MGNLDELINDLISQRLGLETLCLSARPAWTSANNCEDLFAGKRWGTLDKWARSQKIPRYKICGSPAYKTADLDEAVEKTRDKT